jgi:hypothetical protein
MMARLEQPLFHSLSSSYCYWKYTEVPADSQKFWKQKHYTGDRRRRDVKVMVKPLNGCCAVDPESSEQSSQKMSTPVRL